MPGRQVYLAFMATLAMVGLFISGLWAEEIKLASGGVIIEKVADKPFPAVDSKLQAAIKGANLIIVGEPNYQLMQRMVGRERRFSKAYFIFRPDLGIPIFESEYAAAMEIPVKVLLWEREDKKTAIRYKKPSSLLADYKGLDSLGKQLDDILNQITNIAVK